jgi:hypothetical protein
MQTANDKRFSRPSSLDFKGKDFDTDSVVASGLEVLLKCTLDRNSMRVL